MYIFTHLYIYICYTHPHIYICRHMYSYDPYIYIWVYIYIHVCNIYMYTLYLRYMLLPSLPTHNYTYVYMYIYDPCVYICVYTCTHIYVCNMYVYSIFTLFLYIYTPSRPLPPSSPPPSSPLLYIYLRAYIHTYTPACMQSPINIHERVWLGLSWNSALRRRSSARRRSGRAPRRPSARGLPTSAPTSRLSCGEQRFTCHLSRSKNCKGTWP